MEKEPNEVVNKEPQKPKEEIDPRYELKPKWVDPIDVPTEEEIAIIKEKFGEGYTDDQKARIKEELDETTAKFLLEKPERKE